MSMGAAAVGSPCCRGQGRRGRATQEATSMWHPAPVTSPVGHPWLSPEPTEPDGRSHLLQGERFWAMGGLGEALEGEGD